jgi:hypothetical protein
LNIELEGYETKQLWPNLRYYQGFCLERLRKIMTTWFRVVAIPTNFLTEHLPNISQKHYHLDQLAWSVFVKQCFLTPAVIVWSSCLGRNRESTDEGGVHTHIQIWTQTMARTWNFLHSSALHFVISEGNGRHAYHLTSFWIVLKVILLTQQPSTLPLNHKFSLLKTVSLVVPLYTVSRYICVCVITGLTSVV